MPLTSGLTANARALMQSFWPGPLTLIVAKSDLIPDEVSAGLDTVGVRMPSHPIAARLIKETGRPIAAPSANISGKPSPTDASAVWDDMQGKIAGVIDGGQLWYWCRIDCSRYDFSSTDDITSWRNYP